MHNLRLVFQKVVNGLNDASSPEHYLLPHRHKLVLHVAPESSYQMDTLTEKFLKDHWGTEAWHHREGLC